MKHSILIVALISIFAVCGISQTPLADADPVLQGSTAYKMPQSAIDAEIDGKVTMAIQIDKTGKPTKANVVVGPIWPCSSTSTKVLEDLFANLSEEMLKLQFSPAFKNGKPVETEIGLSFTLKNPKLDPKPVEIDLATGKRKPRLVSGGILNGKASSLPKPSYPAEARATRAGGAVNIQVLIDETGKVIRAGAVNGHPTLQFAARYAACEAKFPITILSGTSIKVSGVLTYNFIP